MSAVRVLMTFSRPTRTLLAVSERVCRCISTTRIKQLKEIKETTTENATVVEAISIPLDRTQQILHVEGDRGCTLCRLNLDLNYTDVLILNQFLRPDGEILPKKVTKVCSRQHYNLQKLVKQARRAGLLAPSQAESAGQADTSSESYRWKRYNVYFDEDD